MHASLGRCWERVQGKVAGVAFSKVAGADNVGYIIPWKIVAHFLREFEQHGLFRGCCSVGFRWQDMENTHMREHYKVGGPPGWRADPPPPQPPARPGVGAAANLCQLPCLLVTQASELAGCLVDLSVAAFGCCLGRRFLLGS